MSLLLSLYNKGYVICSVKIDGWMEDVGFKPVIRKPLQEGQQLPEFDALVRKL